MGGKEKISDKENLNGCRRNVALRQTNAADVADSISKLPL